MDNYLVVELQTYADGSCGALKEQFNDKSLAEQNFHQVLAAAAVSQCPIHAAVLLDFSGNMIKREKYIHKEEEEPVVETVEQ